MRKRLNTGIKFNSCVSCKSDSTFTAQQVTSTFGFAEEGGQNCVQGIFVRAGRVLGQRTYYNKNDLSLSPGEFLQAFLAQYYFASVQRDIPKSILVSDLSADVEALTDALNEKAGRVVQLTQQVRGQRARWLSLAKTMRN